MPNPHKNRTHHGGVITVAHQPGEPLPSQAPQALGDVLLVPCGTMKKLPKIATPPLAAAPSFKVRPLPQLNRKFYEKPYGKKVDQLYQLLETHAPALGPRQLEMLAPGQGMEDDHKQRHRHRHGHRHRHRHHHLLVFVFVIVIVIVIVIIIIIIFSSSSWRYHNPFEH